MPSSPIPGYNGGTGNEFVTFTGPSISRTYTLPDASVSLANAADTVSLSGSYSNPVWITSIASSKLTGQVALTNGGTAASLTASNGGIVYSTSSAMAILSGTATAGQMFQSGASAAPSWSTPTYPSASGSAGKILRSDGTNNVYSTSTFSDTYTASNLLYSNGANTVTGLATANNGVLVTSSGGVPSISSTIPSATQDNITRLGTIATVYNNTAQPANIRSSVSATQTINNNTPTAINIWDTSIKDQGGITHSNGVFTLPSAGLYLVFAVFSFPSSLTGVREVYFTINGAGLFCPQTVNGAASGLPTRSTPMFFYQFSANDTVTANAYQTAGVNQACGGGNLDANTQMMGIIKLF